MNIKNTMLAGLFLALGACASDTSMNSSGTSGVGASSAGTQDSTMPADSTSSGASSGVSSSAASGSGTSTASPATGSTAAGTMASAPQMQSWVGVVQMIEPMKRKDAGVGVGSAGAAAAGGVMTTEGSPNDRVYRVTLKLDDGTTQMVTVDTQPNYKSGDRVRYSNGTLKQE